MRKKYTKTYSAFGFWRNITRYPSDHELLSAQRVDFHLMNVLKLYHPAMVQSSKSSATDAMVDFFEQDPENPTLPLYYDFADRYIFSA